MAKAPPYIAMYPTDFLADVGHLGNTELGIYWRLLLVYYRDGKPLPFDADKLRRIAMTFSPEECKALDSVVSEFFVLSSEPDGSRCWRHKRADRELSRATNAHEKKSAAAMATNLKRWGRGSLSESLSDVAKRPMSDGEPERELEPDKDIEPTVLVAPASPEPRKARRLPPCPVEELVAAYHDALPTLPRVAVLNDARKRAIAARWREVAVEHLDCDDPRRSAFEWFVWLFRERVGESDFLTGKRKDWRASIDWLMKPSNFVKVVEGYYVKETK